MLELSQWEKQQTLNLRPYLKSEADLRELFQEQ